MTSELQKKTPKPTILAITSRADHGGGPEHLYQLTRAAGGDISCVIACPDEPPYAPRFQRLENVCQMVSIPHRKLSISAVAKLYEAIKSHKVDIIHSHGKGAGIYSRILAALTGLPTIHTFHGVHIGEYNPLQRQIYCCIEKVLARKTRAIVAVSNSERQTLIDVIGLVEEKIRLIPNGVPNTPDTIKFTAKPNGPVVLLNVNRFDHQKNPDLLIPIAREMKEHQLNCKINVIGYGDKFNHIKNVIEAEGLVDVITLLGPTNDPRLAMKSADIMLSTSRWEGMPLAILEAMSEGLPVIASNVAGNRDIVMDGSTGLLFHLESPSNAVKHIERLVTNREEREMLGRNARTNVAENFSIEQMTRKTIELYNTSLVH